MSTTDGWWKLKFASCVVRKTRSLGALVLCSMTCCVIWCLWIASTNGVDTQFHKFHGRPFARVLHVFLMNDIGQWLPWVPPGSAGRFYKDDVVHNHSAHRYYITRIEGGARYAWYCCYMLNRIKQNWAKTAIHIIRELDLVTFHMKDYLSDEASKIDVRTWCKNSETTGTCYSL